jgi:hypothetical protein
LGNRKTLRVFVKPGGNSQFPSGKREHLVVVVDLQSNFGHRRKIDVKEKLLLALLPLIKGLKTAHTG